MNERKHSKEKPLQKRLPCLHSQNRFHYWPCVLILFLSPAFAAERATPDPDATLKDALVHARHSVNSFWGQFRSVTCVEKVTQEKLGKQGRIEHAQKATFDYLALMSVEQSGLSVEESRLEQGKAGKAKNVPMLITNGVPTLLLVFHPFYRESFRYELDGSPSPEGQVKIHFAHIAGTRSTAAVRLRGKDHPLEIQGTAWLDSATGFIHRIVAEIAAPMGDINLKSVQMAVNYAPMTFPAGNDPYWLPLTADIDIQTARQHWHNVHQYSNYKRFTVNTEDKVLR